MTIKRYDDVRDRCGDWSLGEDPDGDYLNRDEVLRSFLTQSALNAVPGSGELVYRTLFAMGWTSAEISLVALELFKELNS